MNQREVSFKNKLKKSNLYRDIYNLASVPNIKAKSIIISKKNKNTEIIFHSQDRYPKYWLKDEVPITFLVCSAKSELKISEGRNLLQCAM